MTLPKPDSEEQYCAISKELLYPDPVTIESLLWQISIRANKDSSCPDPGKDWPQVMKSLDVLLRILLYDSLLDLHICQSNIIDLIEAK